MELIREQYDSFDEDMNAANGEQLQAWIADHWNEIHAIYTLMQIDGETNWENYYHTWADMSEYGGGDGAVIDLLINDDKKLELTVYDEDSEEYTEVLEVVI